MEADYQRKRDAIRARLTEFADAYREGNERIFEELVFCILTAGASARMGIICIERLRPVFIDGTYGQILAAIKDVHLYPEGRADYIVHTRAYVRDELDFKLKERIESFTDPDTLRDFIANNKGIRGVSYKEASHFLRSIGFRGYAILDKHVLQSLYELGVIDSPKPPVTKKRYIEIENKMKEFAKTIDINFDELDLLLWSGKTGVILK
jgi:N-glycosylase/DNA lyase